MATRSLFVRLGTKDNQKFESDLKKVGKTGQTAIDRITKATKPATTGLKTINVAAKGAGTALSGLKALLPTVGAAFVFSEIIRTVGDFEQSISGLQAVSRATDDQISTLTDTARGLGATTKFSATEAAEGMEFLAKAGFNTNQILAAIPATLNLAAAGGISLAESADIASNVLSGFQLAASETGRVVDVLAAASSRSNTDIIQLGEALKFAAPISREFGVSVESATAAIGVLSNSGLQATLAGTGLRRVIKELGNPSEQLAEFLGGASLQTRTLAELMDILSKSTIIGGDAFDIFGDRGAPAFLVMKSGVETFGDLSEAMANANGAAQEMADVRLDNLFGSATKALSAIKELVISLDDQVGLSAVLRKLIDGFTDELQIINTDRLLQDEETINGVLTRLTEDIEKTKASLSGFDSFAGSIDVALFGKETENALNARLETLEKIRIAVLKAREAGVDDGLTVGGNQESDSKNKALEQAGREAEQLKTLLKLTKDLNVANTPDDRGVAKVFSQFEQTQAKISEFLKSSNKEIQQNAETALQVADEIRFKGLLEINDKVLDEEKKLTDARVKEVDRLVKAEEKRKAANEDVLIKLVAQTAAVTNTKELNFVNLQLSRLNAQATEEEVIQAEALARNLFKITEEKKEALRLEREAKQFAREVDAQKPDFGFGVGERDRFEKNQLEDFDKASAIFEEFKSDLEKHEAILEEIEKQENELHRLAEQFPDLINTEVMVNNLKALDDAVLAEFRRVKIETDSTFKLITQIAESSIKPIENTITDGLVNLEFSLESFRDLAFNVLKDIERQIIQSAISKPLTNLISGKGGLIESAPGFLASFFHEGGEVGESNVRQKRFPASVFKNAPRFHDGLFPDEFPAILQRGETVIPAGKQIAGGGVTVAVSVNIKDGSAESSVSSEGEGQEFGERLRDAIITVIDEEQEPGGRLNKSGNLAA